MPSITINRRGLRGSTKRKEKGKVGNFEKEVCLPINKKNFPFANDKLHLPAQSNLSHTFLRTYNTMCVCQTDDYILPRTCIHFFTIGLFCGIDYYTWHPIKTNL